jgi:lipoyl(octanoyl) transferase
MPSPMRTDPSAIIIRQLGQRNYEPVWRDMQAVTASRGAETTDELWLVEHPPIFTLGLNAKPEHVLAAGRIPVLQVDRGGQVTYHGPGQIVIYTLLDLERRHMGVKALVRSMEQAVIDVLQDFGIPAEGRKDAPGVYVDKAKIAALGLRIRHGRSYHGLAFNVDLELEPFSRINPCGYAGQAVTRCRDLGIEAPLPEIRARLVEHLLGHLGYNAPILAPAEP